MRNWVLLILLFSITLVNAQQLADTITLDSNFKGYSFFYYGEQIRANKVMQIMENCEPAFEEFNSAHEASFFGNVFATIGTGLIIYPFVNLALGNKTNYGTAFAGICFVGISIPIFISSNKKTASSIIKYNNSLKNIGKSTSHRGLYFGTTSSGIALKYSF